MMIDFNEKFAPCPRCGGKAKVTRYVESVTGYNSIHVECLRCWLRLEYSTEYFRAPEVTWTYVLQENDSIFDVWKNGGLDEFKP